MPTRPLDPNPPESPGNPWERLLERVAAATAPRYRVTRLLGSGGMAGVYLADEPRLGRRVAIKVMSPALMMDPDLVARFNQEARITAQLEHPNIARIYDVDEREGLHYFVMEFVAGHSLGDVLASMQAERLPIDVVLHWLAQASSALSYAQRAGVVHRDIKPANMLLTADGNLRLTDFGIAKVADQPGLTSTGFLIGTPAYMSPEQCGSKPVGGPSDQYSLGVVAYELVSGRTPFSGPTMAVLQAHLYEAPPPLARLRPDCPRPVAAAITRMLAKNAEDRFPTVAAAATALGARVIPDEHPMHARVVELAAGRGAAVRPAPPPTRSPLMLTVARPSLRTGEVMSLTPALGGGASATAVSWSTSDPRIATVDGDGRLSTHRPGLVTVTASTGQHRASALITVLEPEEEQEAAPKGMEPRTTRDWRLLIPAAWSRLSAAMSRLPPALGSLSSALSRLPPALSRLPAALDRRLLIAAGLVIALLGGFVLWRAAFSGDDSSAQGSDLAGPIELPPPAPPPVVPESAGVDRDTIPPDTVVTPPVVTPPPAPPPSDPAPVATGTIRIAGTLPYGAEVLIRGAGTVRRWNGSDLAVPPGAYQVEARASGYEEARTELRVQSGVAAVWTPTLSRIVVTPPPSAPPPAPTDSGASAVAAEAAVGAVIDAFAGALQRRDVDALARNYPPRNAQWVSTWRPFYEERRVRELQARVDRVTNFTQTGSTARANFAITVEFTDADGRKRQTFQFEAEFQQRGDDSWAMTAFTQGG